MLLSHSPLPAQVAAPAPGAPVRGRYPDVPDGVATEAFYAGPAHDRDVLVLVTGGDGRTRLHLLGELSFDRSDSRLLVDRDRATLGAGIPVEISEPATHGHRYKPSIHDTSALGLAALEAALEADPDESFPARHRTPVAPSDTTQATAALPPADPLGTAPLSLQDKIKLDFEQQLGSFQLPTL